MNEERNCKNCRNYIKHYYWNSDRLTNAHSGHCKVRIFKRLVRDRETCDKWELAEDERAKQNENIKISLRHTAKQIEDIAALLNCNN